ncbi:MAG: restriction endonuclease subunit S [Ottowia sp.]
MSFAKYPAYKDSGVAWLGRVPGHWEVKRLRHVAALNPSKSEIAEFPRDTEVSFLPMEAVGDDGTLNLDRTRPIAEVESGYTYFREGDVTIAKITPCFENDKGAVMRGLHNGHGFGTTELIVARPSEWHNDERLPAPSFHFAVVPTCWVRLPCTGLADKSASPMISSVTLPVAFPPLSEQTAIATFLDHETAKIDALVAEQEKLIALLQEKRQAVISHAVTKGLNPHAPMKDSGVEWLGEVPGHWEVRRIRDLSSFLTSGPRGWSERISEEGAKFIQSGDLTDELSIAFDEAKRVAVNDDAEAARTKLADGDVVVCITGAKTGNVALCGVVPEDAYVNQHLCLIRPRPDILPDLLAIYLKSDAGQRHFAVAQYGLKQGMSLENIKETPVLVPPIHEQRQIVEIARSTSVSIGALITEARTAITLLQERRTALVSAAVTGQIDVRGWAKAA